MQKHTSPGLIAGLFIISLVGLTLIVGPFFVPEIQGMAKTVLAIIGGIVLFVGMIGLIITKLYVRTSPDMVFVRTGSGGMRVIMDGGAIVVPVIHTVKFIPTNTMRIDVERTGADALLTSDKLRARIRANFYINVPKDEKMIVQASASLPDMISGHDGRYTVQTLIEEKLIGALRTVAATKTLEELNADRQGFADAVQKIVEADLTPNGLKLESVNISGLDQEDPSTLSPDSNIFDAIGAKTIATITATQRVERATIEADAARKVKDQTVEQEKYLAEKDREQAEAVATAEAAKSKVAAEQEQLAQQAIIAAETETRKKQAELDSQAAVVAAEQSKKAQTAKVASDKEVALAQAAKEKESQVAMVQAEEARMIAERQREIAVAVAEQERAEAEAKRIEAEKLKAVADQQMQTAVAVETANRESERSIIAKRADAQQQQIEKNMAADVQAYSVTKQAQAQEDAAKNLANARLTEAKASQEAAALEAEGQKAKELVPVLVAAEKVEVDRKSVEVLSNKLKAETENSEIAMNRELGLAAIQANKEAMIAYAQAMGQALSNANMTIWGDPDAVKKINSSFLSAQAMGMGVGGFLDGLPPQLRTVLEGLMSKLTPTPAPSAEALEAPAAKEESETPAKTAGSDKKPEKAATN